MKAISLWQPHASLWVGGPKIHETRHWPTKVRGWVAVHAAKKLVSECGEHVDELCINRFGAHWRRDLPRGALIGAIYLLGVLETDLCSWKDGDDHYCGNWDDGRFAWERSDYVLFQAPIPYVGRQGFFDVPDALLPLEQLSQGPNGYSGMSAAEEVALARELDE